MNRAVSWFCNIFIKPIVYFLFIQKVKGKENIPKKNFILASNHQSHLDWIADGYICVPRRFRFIGQVDRYSGLLGIARDILYFITGTIRLNRKSEVSKKKVIEEAINSLKNGDILILYPEGTRSRTGEMGKGKWGVARFFLETGVPILPVGIKGTFELLPPGGKLKIKRIVKINIGKPLFFKKEFEEAKKIDKDSKRYKEILQTITNRLMEEIGILKSTV
ncbi:1-acyl-sn-glycerol-3-phosphate acyltransferase [bacterium]|nr:1-acyl-sn-glycerol-3-phosphate acyltransferase [bacterium]